MAGGDQVEWFSAAFPGAKPEEDMDGVHLVRAGRQWTVHLHAFRRYFRRLGSTFDLVIDEVNTIPFFTPLWADIPVFMLIYQLARDVWWYESPFPISLLGFASEPFYLRLYRRVPVLTESKSTQIDLRRIGFSGPITVVPVGTDPVVTIGREKNGPPTFLYVGRLSPSKRVSDIIQAFAIFQRHVPEARLWLVGDGSSSHVHQLRNLVRRLRLDASVDFCGKVSPREKYDRMAEAYALLMASVREGWGLVVTEANACGTPAVVYDVPGLRDSVLNGQTGLVVEPSPKKLAAAMLMLAEDRTLYRRLAEEATRLSAEYSFEKSTEVMRNSITSIVRAGTLETAVS